ncbi:hypothetical protein BP5796_00292 [Coleophoma crateriformis]|uniref:Uncharacterized protein n=1 Tax=Coleophoma crateriformis TaxID=565419 RepID=A0A3D8T7K3_9HELO|nr:hypothetical protein BP5796_00292 [Coleophoma crateriformis]
MTASLFAYSQHKGSTLDDLVPVVIDLWLKFIAVPICHCSSDSLLEIPRCAIRRVRHTLHAIFTTLIITIGLKIKYGTVKGGCTLPKKEMRSRSVHHSQEGSDQNLRCMMKPGVDSNPSRKAGLMRTERSPHSPTTGFSVVADQKVWTGDKPGLQQGRVAESGQKQDYKLGRSPPWLLWQGRVLKPHTRDAVVMMRGS